MPEPISVAPATSPPSGTPSAATSSSRFAATTNGSLTALETIAGPGEGPPFQTHAHEDGASSCSRAPCGFG